MMKKIRTIKDLNDERSRLTRRQADLEKRMGMDWQDIKHGFRPASAAYNFFSGTFSGIAFSVAQSLLVKSASRLFRWFRK